MAGLRVVVEVRLMAFPAGLAAGKLRPPGNELTGRRGRNCGLETTDRIRLRGQPPDAGHRQDEDQSQDTKFAEVGFHVLVGRAAPWFQEFGRALDGANLHFGPVGAKRET